MAMQFQNSFSLPLSASSPHHRLVPIDPEVWTRHEPSGTLPTICQFSANLLQLAAVKKPLSLRRRLSPYPQSGGVWYNHPQKAAGGQKNAESKGKFLRKKGVIWSLLFSLTVLAAAAGICPLPSLQVDDYQTIPLPWRCLFWPVQWIAIIDGITGMEFFRPSPGSFAPIMYLPSLFQFEWSIAGYPLTFTAMLLVSLIVSTLTTQIKSRNSSVSMWRPKMRVNLSFPFPRF